MSYNTGITIPGTPGDSRTYGYTTFGLPTNRKIDDGYIQNFSFQFDPKKGNLLSRTGYLAGTETIAEGAYTSGLVYDADGDRIKMYVSDISHLDGQSFQVHYRYDPWGRLVDNSTGQPYAPGSEPALLLGRGFTGHEYLPWFGLINANARLYDPLLSRFLSPDPYVQDPDNPQNFNRYSYCLNNPLRYTDESEEVVGTVLAISALIGGISNWLANGAEFSWRGLGYYWVGLHVGVFSALTGDWIAGISQAAGVWAGAIVGATTGALSGAATSSLTTFGNNIVSGKKWNSGLGSAALTGALSGALSGAFSGAMKGYQYAKEHGANPWNRNYTDESENGLYFDHKMESYEATSPKSPVKQPAKTKHCYGYTNEYADQGHFNHSADDFINAVEGADGFDPMKSYNLVCGTTGEMNRVSDLEWRSLGYFLSNNAEVQSTTFNHAFNVRGITIGYKLRMFGGGIGDKLHLFSALVHDPLIGDYRYLSHLDCVGVIHYY